MTDVLPSWREKPTRAAILDFVTAVTTPRPGFVEPSVRVAVFDNDGTLWTEKPMPTQLHYLLGHWKAAATADPALAEQQPYRAAVTGELAWLGEAIDKHYGGDDADLGLLIAAVSAASAGASVEEYEASVAAFYREARHLTLHSSYAQTVYQPMVELLRLLNDHGFRNYIVSGGERDFMRPMSQDYYSIPPHRVIGTAMGMEYDADDNLVRFGPKMDFFDDGTEKPVRIWMRVAGRRRRWPSDCSACCRRTRSTRTGRCSRRASAMRCSMSRTPRCRSRSRRSRPGAGADLEDAARVVFRRLIVQQLGPVTPCGSAPS